MKGRSEVGGKEGLRKIRERTEGTREERGKEESRPRKRKEKNKKREKKEKEKEGNKVKD